MFGHGAESKESKGRQAVVIQYFRQVGIHWEPHPHWHLQNHRNINTDILHWSSTNRFLMPYIMAKTHRWPISFKVNKQKFLWVAVTVSSHHNDKKKEKKGFVPLQLKLCTFVSKHMSCVRYSLSKCCCNIITDKIVPWLCRLHNTAEVLSIRSSHSLMHFFVVDAVVCFACCFFELLLN